MSFCLTLGDYRTQLESAPQNAQARWTERQGCIVTLDYDGSSGQGEAAPLPGYVAESLGDARSALEGFSLSTLVDPTELAPSALRALLDLPELSRTPSARFALQTALLDLTARRRGLPLHRLLRELSPACAAIDAPRLPLAELVDELDRTRAIDRVDRALALGFAGIKVKIGRSGRFEAELELLGALRAVAPQVPLRLDANGSFSAAEVHSRLRALVAFDPEFVEEPLAFGGPALLDSPLPVALDESLRAGFNMGRDAARARRLAAVVLKPGPLGGLLACIELAERARAAGVSAVVSHAFEGPVAYAAATELAVALGAGRFAHGLAPHAALAPWPVRLRPAALAGAALVPHAEAGLGLPRVEPGFAR